MGQTLALDAAAAARHGAARTRRGAIAAPDNDAAASRIMAWIIDAGLEGLDGPDRVTGYCERLVGAGVPLWRASFGADALHPLIVAQGHRWLAGEGVCEEFYARAHNAEEEAEWQQSPWYWMLEQDLTELRCRLAAGQGMGRFPLLAMLAEQGGTDYAARIVRFGERASLGETRGLAASFTTRTPQGFGCDHLALIDATLPIFALTSKATMAVETAGTLLRTYVGKSAAERVLRGEIARGHVVPLRTVLWFSDLTGFTRLADTLPQDRLLELLNAYTDCLVGVVQDHGGEVLKFMGDGMLAAFSEGAAACRRALDAAEAARTAVAALNETRAAAGLPVTGFTLALHEGEVLSGNVGSRDRLDFTVVGPAVNEVSRIQAMSRMLDQPILISASFAAACNDQRGRLVSLGRYALRGVGRAQELFTLDPSEQPARFQPKLGGSRREADPERR